LDDIQTLAYPVLRHRILLNYRAEAEAVSVDNVIERLLQTIKPPIIPV
jgi:MoxR-like ATPase